MPNGLYELIWGSDWLDQEQAFSDDHWVRFFPDAENQFALFQELSTIAFDLNNIENFKPLTEEDVIEKNRGETYSFLEPLESRLDHQKRLYIDSLFLQTRIRLSFRALGAIQKTMMSLFEHDYLFQNGQFIYDFKIEQSPDDQEFKAQREKYVDEYDTAVEGEIVSITTTSKFFMLDESFKPQEDIAVAVELKISVDFSGEQPEFLMQWLKLTTYDETLAQRLRARFNAKEDDRSFTLRAQPYQQVAKIIFNCLDDLKREQFKKCMVELRESAEAGKLPYNFLGSIWQNIIADVQPKFKVLSSDDGFSILSSLPDKHSAGERLVINNLNSVYDANPEFVIDQLQYEELVFIADAMLKETYGGILALEYLVSTIKDPKVVGGAASVSAAGAIWKFGMFRAAAQGLAGYLMRSSIAKAISAKLLASVGLSVAGGAGVLVMGVGIGAIYKYYMRSDSKERLQEHVERQGSEIKPLPASDPVPIVSPQGTFKVINNYADGEDAEYGLSMVDCSAAFKRDDQDNPSLSSSG